MNKTIKWVIYARKSTESDDKQIQSIDDQVRYMKEIVSREGLDVLETITESKSAKVKNNREGFTRLLSLIDSGKVQGVLCWKMDRLSRNPVESAHIQEALQLRKLECIYTAERKYLPEDNALIYAVEQGMANQYSRDLSKTVKRGMQSKAEKGWFPNIPPIGYLNSKTRDKGNETILVDEARFSIVRKMWDLMLTGSYSPPQVLRIATNEWGLTTPTRKKLGGKAVSVSYIYKILTSEFYAGTFTYSGKVYQGKHPPMITRDEFDRVQMLLGKKGKPRQQVHSFPFTGIMRCGECGAVITATEKKKFVGSLNKISTYVYYHCTKRKKYISCKQAPIRVENLETQVIKLINENIIDKDFYDLSLRILREMHDTEIETRQRIYTNQLETVDVIQKKLDRIVGFLINGSISEEDYNTHKKELEESLVRQKASLKETEKRAQNWIQLTENVFHFAKSASIAFVEGDDQIRKEILTHLGWNHQIKAKEVLIDLASWFSVLKNGELEVSSEIKRLELDKTLTPERRKEAFASIHTKLCAGKDLNLRSPKGDRFTVCCD
jgi:site-specific DNA recombinase